MPDLQQREHCWPRAAFSVPLRERASHYKLTQTERATWQNSDIWTLWTKTLMYRDKYHFIIKIYNENESQNDCLQLLTCFIIFQSDLCHRYWREQTWRRLFHENAEGVRTHNCFASEAGPTLRTLVCTLVMPFICGRTRGRMVLGSIWDKAKCIKYFPLSSWTANCKDRKSLTNL